MVSMHILMFCVLRCGVGSDSPCVTPTPVSGESITPPPEGQLSHSLCMQHSVGPAQILVNRPLEHFLVESHADINLLNVHPSVIIGPNRLLSPKVGWIMDLFTSEAKKIIPVSQ